MSESSDGGHRTAEHGPFFSILGPLGVTTLGESTTRALCDDTADVEDVAWLAQALALRLQAVVPPHFAVTTGHDGRVVEISYRGRMTRRSAIGVVLDGDPERIFESAAEVVMSDVQDEVAEELRIPWPGERTLPMPGAEIRGSELHLWFGNADAPAVTLPAIPLPRSGIA